MLLLLLLTRSSTAYTNVFSFLFFFFPYSSQQVCSIVKALRSAESELKIPEGDAVGVRKLTKAKREELESMANVFVVRWTWLFRAVQVLWNENSKEGGVQLQKPRGCDFLAMSKKEQDRLDGVEDEFGSALDEKYSVLGLKRIFDNIASRKRPKIEGTNDGWQRETCLEESEKWVLGGKLAKFWPWKRPSRAPGVETTTTMGEGCERAFVYPAIIPSDKACSTVPSTALLMRAMGAALEEKITIRTTHVLVKELNAFKCLPWSAVKVNSKLREMFQGACWWAELKSVEERTASVDPLICCVVWVQELWPPPLRKSQLDAAAGSESGYDTQEDKNVVGVIMCGFPGSGKSTFAHRLAQKAEESQEKFEIVCQDDLITQKRCDEAVARAGEQRLNIVIDRVNLQTKDRTRWTKMLRDVGCSTVFVVLVRTEIDLCVDRANKRRDHPTIPFGQAGEIIDDMMPSFVMPVEGEGSDENGGEDNSPDSLMLVDGANEAEINDAVNHIIASLSSPQPKGGIV